MHNADLTIIVWKWHAPGYRTKYNALHVNTMHAMVQRHMEAKHRFICITDDPKDIECETAPLWDDFNGLINPNGSHLPSCYRRLKIFSTATQEALGIKPGSRVVSLDIDAVIVKKLDPILVRKDDFVAWKGIGSFNPVVYNGSLFMFTAGKVDTLWDDFDPMESPRLAKNARFFGSDQAWMSYKMTQVHGAPGLGVNDGVFSYARDMRRKPLNQFARIVFFNGKWKPWDPMVIEESPWVLDHWKA